MRTGMIAAIVLLIVAIPATLYSISDVANELFSASKKETTTHTAPPRIEMQKAAPEPLQDVTPQSTLDDGTEVFMMVEQMPQIIGGLGSIQSKIKYPEVAKKSGIEGRVIIQFVVTPEGKVIDTNVVRGIGGGCDEEAVRAVRQATFKPGRQRGKAVHVKMSLPITFKLK